MHNLYASLVPHAIAVALSPLPIAALVFLLLSNRPKQNSLGFLSGWFIAIIVNVGLFAFIFGASGVPQGGDPLGVRAFRAVLGALLIFFAVNEWRRRPRNGQKPKVPKWMQEIASFGPTKSFLIAFGLVTINAKNTVLDVAAGDMINNNSTSSEEAVLAVILFAFIASLSIIIPVIAFLVFGDQLKGILGKVNTFFIAYSNVILSILFLFLGVSIFLKAF